MIGHRDVLGTSGQPCPKSSTRISRLLDGVYETGEPFIGQSVPILLQTTPQGPLEPRFLDFIYQPIRDADDRWPASSSRASTSPTGPGCN